MMNERDLRLTSHKGRCRSLVVRYAGKGSSDNEAGRHGHGEDGRLDRHVGRRGC